MKIDLPFSAVSGESTAEPKRASARRRVRQTVHVTHTESREVFGRVVDLSRRGLRVELPHRLRVGTAWDLTIDCGTGERSGPRVRIGAEVRWCGHGAAPGSFECGLQIKAMNSRDAAELEALYERLGSGRREG